MKTLKITPIESYNEWKEIVMEAKRLGFTTDYLRYNLTLYNEKNKKIKRKKSTYL